MVCFFSDVKLMGNEITKNDMRHIQLCAHVQLTNVNVCAQNIKHIMGVFVTPQSFFQKKYGTKSSTIIFLRGFKLRWLGYTFTSLTN
jgi:hypothetical protein